MVDIDKLIELDDRLDQLLKSNGESSAENEPIEIQHWMLLTIVSLSRYVALGATKQERRELMESVPPAFKSDVEQMAKIIWSKQNAN